MSSSEKSTRAEVLDTIGDIVHRRTGVDLTGRRGVSHDEQAVYIRLGGLTLSDDGDIIAAEREYTYEATVLVEVAVSGTVRARNDEDARQEAIDLTTSIQADTIELSNYNGDDLVVETFDVYETTLDTVSEV